MAQPPNQIGVYLESGKKKTFAGAVDWPGWSRSGRDEASALQALFEYGPRYAHVLHAAGLDFQAPATPAAFTVVEQLTGNATTDFGAPAIAPASDARAVDADELHHLQRLLLAYWQGFDVAADAAMGKALRKGPRGGGRDLPGIIQHVLDADASYLGQLGGKFKPDKADDLDKARHRIRQAMLAALAAAARGELPTHGPRGGARWTPRYFVRRVAWHILDHTWEIEDRQQS